MHPHSFSPRLAHSLSNLYDDNNFSDDDNSTPPSSFVPSPSPALSPAPPSGFSFGYTSTEPQLPPAHLNFNQEANTNLNSLTGANTVSTNCTVGPMNRTGYSLFSSGPPNPRRGPLRGGLSRFPGRYLSRSIPVSDHLATFVVFVALDFHSLLLLCELSFTWCFSSSFFLALFTVSVLEYNCDLNVRFL